MRSTIDLWDDIGGLAEDEILQVITKLFSVYEAALQLDSDNAAALQFFRNLDNVITQTCECNSNRR